MTVGSVQNAAQEDISI